MSGGGTRSGHGWRGLTGPKKLAACARCGKRGMNFWKCHIVAGKAVWVRSCRYCNRVERSDTHP